MIEIPDASIAIKWFVRVEEGGLDAADAVRARILATPHQFAVPSLFLYEVAAALCRRNISAADVKQNLQLLWALAVPVVSPDETLLALTAELAFKYRLTAYDAAYVALAVHLRGAWLTFDAEAARRLRGLGVARLLR